MTPHPDDPTDPTPDGFDLVLPPGWDTIPLRSGTGEAIQRIVKKSVSQLPASFPKDDIPNARLKLIKELKDSVKEARKSDGLTLYLPVERMHGLLVPASFVASKPLAAPTTSSEPRAVLHDLARTSEDASVRKLDGSDAVRTLRKQTASPDRGVDVPSWQVQYTVPIPGPAPTHWLTFSFGTLTTTAVDLEFTETLIDLFDAVMTTFRWSYA
ncbi:hypothetical protein ACFWMQ_04980 [Streptomyces sp. NPDC058372]|uniref:hypothetical protein n=1 Tax=Streptomyces sp. NPDC058372 TaxID=3346464 RepID=UPI00365E8D97